MTSSRRRWPPIVIAAAAVFFVGALGTTMTELGPWYQNLDFPAWKPPDVLFGPAWTLIFALVALLAYFGWINASSRREREWLIGLFSLNGFLNVLWSFLFFRLQRPDLALIEVFGLWLSILVLIVFLWRFSRRAAWLLVPYIAWVTLAAALNWSVVELNPGAF